MRKFVLLILFLFSSVTAAQQAPPAIILFDITLLQETPVTINALENGEISGTLAWNVINANETQHRLLLQAYRINDWVEITNDEQNGAPWAFMGERTLDVQHPLKFGQPTYRLQILDAADHVLDQAIIIVPYDDLGEALPEIRSFTSSGRTSPNTAAVSWEVTNRLPTSNLIFEQVLSDGSTRSAELPREVLWIASKGDGVVQTDTVSMIRLRVIDLITNEVYDEATIEIPAGSPPPDATAPQPVVNNPPRTCESSNLQVPVTGTPNDTCTSAYDSTLQQQVSIDSFTASTQMAAPTEEVRLAWQVSAGDSVLHIYDMTEIERARQSGETPVAHQIINDSTSTIFTLPLEFTHGVRFVLWAGNNHASGSTSPGLFAFLAYKIIDVYPPQTGGAQIVSFNASPISAALGDPIIFTWEVTGADLALLEISDARFVPPSIYQSIELVTSGSTRVIMPDIFAKGMSTLLWAANYRADGSIEKLVSSPLQINVVGNSVSETASYQHFQNGHMIWRGDTGTIWVLAGSGIVYYFPQSAYTSFPDNAVTDIPPEGAIKPANGFGRVWGTIGYVRDALGWAVSEEQGYIANINMFNNPSGNLSYDVSLPDGRIIAIKDDATWAFK